MTSVLLTLGTVLGGTAILAALALYLATTPWQKAMAFGVIAGLCLYSGVGAAYPEVPSKYLNYYFGFLLTFVIAFKFFCIVLIGTSRHFGRVLPKVFASVERTAVWRAIIWTYAGLQMVSLVYPEFRLHLLLSPPTPDLSTYWARQWEVREVDLLLKLVEYARLLLGPFFFVALYRCRDQILWLGSILAWILYVQYVATGYIGRGDMVMAMALVGLALWMHRPRLRPALIAVAIMMLPVVLAASYIYGTIRIGGSVSDVGLLQIASVIDTETGFPRDVGMPIIESGMRVDFGQYVKWIVTLPIPKILTGQFTGARINYEISEFVLGVSPDQQGWYVVLPGLVAEAVYIFGPYLFWMHGVFVAFLAALVVRLAERTPQLLFLAAHVVILFAYVMNRAGIAALLPMITNEFILFYLFVIVRGFRLLPQKRYTPLPLAAER